MKQGLMEKGLRKVFLGIYTLTLITIIAIISLIILDSGKDTAILVGTFGTTVSTVLTILVAGNVKEHQSKVSDKKRG